MKLWLDDERDPKDANIQAKFCAKGDEIWVKTIEEAIELIWTNQVTHISFDHDLGYEKTGYDLAKWIEQEAALGTIKPFNYRIHSQNRVGSRNIAMAMFNAKKFWRNA